MISNRRILLASVFGLLTGVFCWLAGVIFLGNEYSFAQWLYIILSRGMIGFTIGISALRMGWLAHGALIGLVVGIPFANYELIVQDVFNYQTWVIIALIPIGVFYGVAVEYFTTKVFKEPSPYAT